MDTKTYRIEKVEDEADARRKGLVPIPPHELASVEAMTRPQRVAWLSNAQRAERRAKRKAQRRARKANRRG